MGRAVDVLALALLLAAAVAFAFGVRALDREEDRYALYWLAVGALAMKSSTDLFRPRKAR
jgi:hypothetical protein